jgi:hypothetical protein
MIPPGQEGLGGDQEGRRAWLVTEAQRCIERVARVSAAVLRFVLVAKALVAVPPDRDTPGIEDLGESARKRVRRPRTMPSMCDRFSLPGVRFTLVRSYAPAYVTGR